MSDVSIIEAAKILASANKILLLTHARPDGDTLASAYGLKYALEASGKHIVNVTNADEIPKRLMFISEMKEDIRKEKYKEFSPDIIVSIDVAELHLLGDYCSTYTDKVDLKIDHHPNGALFGKKNYIDGTASAVGEIVYDIICELEKTEDAKLTSQSATLIYAAIISDSGCFKYSNTTPKTLRMAAELIERGADFTDVVYRLFQIRTIRETVALRAALNHLNVYRNGSILVVTLTNEMKEEEHITDDDFSAIVSLLKEIEGVDLAIVLKQVTEEPYKYKISMRSSARVSASQLCELLGGGGHERAAGALITADNPEDAEYKVIETVQSVIGYA